MTTTTTRSTMNYIKHNIIGIVALFIALGGTSYAVTTLPTNSVGTKQIRNGSVHLTDLATTARPPTRARLSDLVTSAVNGQLDISVHGEQGAIGPIGPQGVPGGAGPEGPTGPAGPRGEALGYGHVYLNALVPSDSSSNIVAVYQAGHLYCIAADTTIHNVTATLDVNDGLSGYSIGTRPVTAGSGCEGHGTWEVLTTDAAGSAVDHGFYFTVN